MTVQSQSDRHRVLLVEDDLDVMDVFKEIFGRHAAVIELLTATDAGQALDLIESGWVSQRVEAMVLDLMMPYGSAIDRLGGAGDPEGDETGVLLLETIRKAERGRGLESIWIAVVTARGQPSVLRKVSRALGSNGCLHQKPANGLLLEHQIFTAIGLPSPVDANLLPRAEEPPSEEGAIR